MILNINNKEFKFEYDVNGLIELEERFGISIAELDKAVSKGAFKTFRSLFWAGLLSHDSLIEVKEAGSLMSMYMKDGNDMSDISGVIMQGLSDGGFLPKQAMQKIKEEMKEEKEKLMGSL